jgi:hypothetical protein
LDQWQSPLFGAREGCIHERLVQIQFASLMQMPRQKPQRFYQFSASHPLLKSAVTGLEWRIFLRQLAPLRPSAKHPEHPIQHRTRVMPRTTAIIGPPRAAQHRLYHQPLFFA